MHKSRLDEATTCAKVLCTCITFLCTCPTLYEELQLLHTPSICAMICWQEHRIDKGGTHLGWLNKTPRGGNTKQVDIIQEEMIIHAFPPFPPIFLKSPLLLTSRQLFTATKLMGKGTHSRLINLCYCLSWTRHRGLSVLSEHELGSKIHSHDNKMVYGGQDTTWEWRPRQSVWFPKQHRRAMGNDSR